MYFSSLLDRSFFHNRIQPGSLIADVDCESRATLLYYFAEEMEEEPCWFLLYFPWTKEASKLDPGSLGSISGGNTTAIVSIIQLEMHIIKPELVQLTSYGSTNSIYAPIPIFESFTCVVRISVLIINLNRKIIEANKGCWCTSLQPRTQITGLFCLSKFASLLRVIINRIAELTFWSNK